MSHPPSSTNVRRLALVGAELGLLALALGTAASFTRLFVDWGWLARLAVPVGVAWALSVLLRRARLRTGVAIAVQTVAAVLVLSWVFAPGSLAVVLPTPTTASVLADEVRDSFAAFGDLVAPVPATTGFLVVVAAAMWLIVAFADIAALRFGAPVQAAVPYVSTFAAVGILARESGRGTAALAFVAGLATYAATQRALSGAGQRWVSGRTVQGTRAVLGGAVLVAVVAVLGGMLVAPLLPGDEQPVLDLRDLGEGDGPRTVVSPFVGLRSLLGERSDDVMFTVQADQPAYWRLTSLEEYDPEREIWVSRGSYQRTDGDLPETLSPAVVDGTLEQRIRMEALSSLWLPGAYAPVRIDSGADVSFDSRSSSLILRDGDDANGLEYSLQSELADVAEVVEDAAAPAGDTMDETYLDAPQLDPATRRTLTEVVGDARTPYDQMRRLQDWFRTEFSYDDQVDYSDSSDALAAFLSARRGFCQQFSSTFALFARSLGLPSRVAVGFTQGDVVEGDDGGAEYVVRGRHAHAWPEVYLVGAGWVPFEPTPQRGDPQSQTHTGVAPQQAEPPPAQAATTTSTTVPQSQPPSSVPSTLPPEVDATAEPPEAATTDDPGGPPWWLVLVAAAVLTLGAAVVLFRRSRRRHGGAEQGAVVARAWDDLVRALAPLELRPERAETPLEFAQRADRRLNGDVVGAEPWADGAVLQLARIETARRYGQVVPDDEQCAAAVHTVQQVREHVREVTSRRRRAGEALAAAGGRR
jgi:transglutaminase-like putative cysteine protease